MDPTPSDHVMPTKAERALISKGKRRLREHDGSEQDGSMNRDDCEAEFTVVGILRPVILWILSGLLVCYGFVFAVG